jgi:hypothetical protein
VVGDLAVANRVAAAICGPEADSSEREQALIVAEAQVTLKRVRRARTQIMDQMSLVPPTQDRHAQGSISTAGVAYSSAYLEQRCCGSNATSVVLSRAGSGCAGRFHRVAREYLSVGRE